VKTKIRGNSQLGPFVNLPIHVHLRVPRTQAQRVPTEIDTVFLSIHNAQIRCNEKTSNDMQNFPLVKKIDIKLPKQNQKDHTKKKKKKRKKKKGNSTSVLTGDKILHLWVEELVA
jgi:hypothetical protein